MGRLSLSSLPVKSTAVGALLVYIHKRALVRVPDTLISLYLVLLLLNWTNLPLRWHWRVFAPPILSIRFQQLKAALGWHSGKGSRAQELGLEKKWYHLKGIGVPPQSASTMLQARVTFGESDFLMHMNNAVYNSHTDYSRMTWTVNYLATLLVNEKPTSHLGGVSTVFFKEIPMLSKFETDTRVIGWTDRWAYAWTRFLLPLNAPSALPGKDIICHTAKGPRILCSIVLCKITIKLPKQQTSARVGRVMSAAGLGPDASNWRRAEKLRKERKLVKWMVGIEDPDGSDGLEAFEEDRLKVLELLDKLGAGDRKDVWMAVDAFADKWSKSHPVTSP